nr:hypothetical protein [Tanacetum cinerariifolium]
MVITFHNPFWSEKWLVQGGTALGKDFLKSVDGCQFTKNCMVIDSPYHSVCEELASPKQTAIDQMLLFYDPAVFGVPAGFFISAGFFVVAVWLFAAVLFCSYCWNIDAILELTSEDLSRILKLTLLNSRLGDDCWELQN